MNINKIISIMERRGISPLDSYRNVSETSVLEVDRAQT